MSDPSTERRNGNGRVNWQAVGVVFAILGAAYAIAEARGGEKAAFTQIEGRVAKLESLVEVIYELRAQVRFLVDAENRRQLRDAPRGNP